MTKLFISNLNVFSICTLYWFVSNINTRSYCIEIFDLKGEASMK